MLRFNIILFCFVLFVLKEQMGGDVSLRSAIVVGKYGFYIFKWLKEKSKEE